MNTQELQAKIKLALETGNWMIRASVDGCAYNGFTWSPVGEWTIAPDWDPTPERGGGLHGQGPEAGGYICGKRVEFCLTEGQRVIIGDDKLKVRQAMILLIDDLSSLHGLRMFGSLNLSGTAITSLPEGLNVGGRRATR